MVDMGSGNWVGGFVGSVETISKMEKGSRDFWGVCISDQMK